MSMEIKMPIARLDLKKELNYTNFPMLKLIKSRGVWYIVAFSSVLKYFMMVLKYGNSINYSIKQSNNSKAGPNINNKNYIACANG